MDQFFNSIYRLRFIERWATSFGSRKENVAEHCFSVAVISHLLALLNNEFNSSETVNAEELVVLALYHDSFESYTSHIVSPVKNTTEEFKEAHDKMRAFYTSRLIHSLPEVLRDKLTLFEAGSHETKVNEIISAADDIDAYLFCKFQVNIGNNDYANKLEITERRVDRLREELNYVDFFFQHLCDFDKLELEY
ncbi:MAG: 5'-deoxynucleotidase [Coriobacteriia bacterium]|nr:5'-deoxynucleotidase [Coriobacteriia bacterium]